LNEPAELYNFPGRHSKLTNVRENATDEHIADQNVEEQTKAEALAFNSFTFSFLDGITPQVVGAVRPDSKAKVSAMKLNFEVSPKRANHSNPTLHCR
jgi:hypothetical protein